MISVFLIPKLKAWELLTVSKLENKSIMQQENNPAQLAIEQYVGFDNRKVSKSEFSKVLKLTEKVKKNNPAYAHVLKIKTQLRENLKPGKVSFPVKVEIQNKEQYSGLGFLPLIPIIAGAVAGKIVEKVMEPKKSLNGIDKHPLFGEIYSQFAGNAQKAIKHLLKTKKGICSNVFYREDIGHIDLPYGWKTGSGLGLLHIIDKHGKDIQKFGWTLSDFLTHCINKGQFSKVENKNRIKLEGDVFRCLIEKDKKNKAFILTAFTIKKKTLLGINQIIDGIDFKLPPLYSRTAKVSSQIDGATFTDCRCRSNLNTNIRKNNAKEKSSLRGVSLIPSESAAEPIILQNKNIAVIKNKIVPNLHSGLTRISDIKNEKYNSLGLKGQWLNLIGDACDPTYILLYGYGGGGKTTLALKFSEMQAFINRPVYYAAGEQFATPTLQNIINQLNIVDHPCLLFGKDLNGVDLKKFKVVVIDSKEAINFQINDLADFKKKYPETSLIITCQSTKDGQFRGTEQWRNDVDTMIQFQGGTAYTNRDKNRWGRHSELKMF